MRPARDTSPQKRTSPPASDSDRISLLDVAIDRIRLPDLLSIVHHAISARRRVTILYVNVHCMNVAGRDGAYREILRRVDLVYCDGAGVRLGAWLAGLGLPERMTGADWIHDLCRLAVRQDLVLFLLGSEAGSVAEAAAVLPAQYPGLRIAGAMPGFGATSDTVDVINASGADILLVGMGTPTQEKWIDAHRDRLEVPVVWAVGALFDFVSGRIPRGPRWMTDHGLEWLCRLLAEPSKLWRRYLIGNPVFLWRVVRRYRLRM